VSLVLVLVFLAYVCHTMLEDPERRITRTYGTGHPQAEGTRYFLKQAREVLNELGDDGSSKFT